MNLSLSEKSKSRRAGFTLFELLVTMVIITLLVGLSLVGFGSNRNADGVERGLSALHSMIRVARSQALMNGVSSRLIINFDDSDPENFLRQIGVVIKDDSKVGNWRAVERGALLPEGVYVVPRTKVTFAADWPSVPGDRKSVYKIENSDSAKDTAIFQYEYPLLHSVPENVGPEWIAIQFAPNGRPEAVRYDGGGLVSNNNQLVLGSARFSDAGLVFNDSENMAGVGIKLNGSSYSIDDPTFLGDEPEEGP